MGGIEEFGPNALRPGDERFRKFIELTAGQPPRGLLVRAAALVSGVALDLGSGAGGESLYLADQGFEVVAVDGEPAAAKYLDGRDGVRFVASRFEDFEFGIGLYDLVNAQFALPFIGRAQFGDVWGRILGALRPGGVIAGQFFGPNDSWNIAATELAIQSETEALALLEGFEIVEWEEEEQDGLTADKSLKHWHVFHFIARKPAA